jgi:hypothetical protein
VVFVVIASMLHRQPALAAALVVHQRVPGVALAGRAQILWMGRHRAQRRDGRFSASDVALAGNDLGELPTEVEV